LTAQTFSESWHRIAEARIGLLPSVQVQRQRFGGADWYVLQDRFTQRFFRLTPQAWRFVSRLSPRRTVDDAWRDALERFPEDAPSQHEVIQLLGQLHQSNLLYFRSQPDSAEIFDRYRQYKQRELYSKLLGFLYLRIPVWNPNDWLNAIAPLVRACVSLPAAIIWLIVVVIGGKAALENLPQIADQSQGLLALDNLVWLYLCMAGMKVLHELAHAFVCKRFGGEVHVFGVMLLVLAPLPYVDATSSWAFRSRYERALVGAVGVLSELFMAAIGAIVWANTGPGLVHTLAFNVMLLGSVSSLLFNGNPLLRFDAYYVLCDLVDIPNLYQRANQQWLYFADRYLLGTRDAKTPATDRREWWWLTGYGVLSFVYRMLVIVLVLEYVADQWFLLGVIFAITTLIMLVVMPFGKLFSHLSGPAVARNRTRAIAASLAGILVPVLLLSLVPWRDSIRAPGIVESISANAVAPGSPGRLVALHARNGDRVQAGQLIARLSNPELESEIRLVQHQVRETELLRNQALVASPADVQPLERRLAMLRDRLLELEYRFAQLSVVARHSGTFVAPKVNERLGSWMQRGEPLGDVVDLDNLRFVAVVTQQQADELFAASISGVAIRLRGQIDREIQSDQFNVLPYQRQRLASAALGWMGGGSIPVRQDDQRGEMAAEPFFEVRVQLNDLKAELLTLNGLSGQMRIVLAPSPLLSQWKKWTMQQLQKRYQI
jgi:putative peptide zinc metalloprotease protein